MSHVSAPSPVARKSSFSISYRAQRLAFCVMTLLAAAVTATSIWVARVLELSCIYQLLLALLPLSCTGYLLTRACRIIDYDNPTELAQVKKNVQKISLEEALALYGSNTFAHSLYSKKLFEDKCKKQSELSSGVKPLFDIYYRCLYWIQAFALKLDVPKQDLQDKFFSYCKNSTMDDVLREAARVTQEKNLKEKREYWTLLERFGFVDPAGEALLKRLAEKRSEILAKKEAATKSIRDDAKKEGEAYESLLREVKSTYETAHRCLEKTFDEFRGS